MTNRVIASLSQILNTTAGDTGADKAVVNAEQNLNRLAQVQFNIGSGDTVVLEGKIESTLNYGVIYTADTDVIINVDLPIIYRARRTIDGASADSEVWVQKLGEY
tara:strand:+ start:157 stop:471 length:315 start_codon:yes stop_codon:yes gene_type:complete